MRVLPSYDGEHDVLERVLEARAILHEMDHLDGVLFTSKIEKYVTQEELDELIRQQEEEDSL